MAHNTRLQNIKRTSLIPSVNNFKKRMSQKRGSISTILNFNLQSIKERTLQSKNQTDWLFGSDNDLKPLIHKNIVLDYKKTLFF